MGQLEVSGPAAREGLSRALTNDLSAIGPGQGQYTLICEDDGGVIDDLIVYALADRYLLVVNASNIAACRDRLARPPAGRASTWPTARPRWRCSPCRGRAGPRRCGRWPPRRCAFSLDYFEIGEDVIAGVPCLIARTGYTGEPGRRADVPVGRRAGRSGTR